MIKCPTGWIVVPSESGTGHVPFFVHVRSADIHWKEDPYLKTIITNSTDIPNDTVDNLLPGHTYRITRDNWAIEIQNDGLVTATSQVSITDTFVFTDDTHTGIKGFIDLPLFLKNDNYFNIQVTLSPGEDNVRYAIPYVNKVNAYQTINNEDIFGHNVFKLTLSSPNHTFADNFVFECKDTRVFVTVRGYLPYYEYKNA